MSSLLESFLIIVSAMLVACLSIGLFCMWFGWFGERCKFIWQDFIKFRQEKKWKPDLKTQHKTRVLKALSELFLYSVLWLLIVAACLFLAKVIWVM